MKKTIGILAHVDAGKTTFSEQLLFNTGRIRRAGRVDDKNTILDADAIERQRGITIFSDTANFDYNDSEYYIVDTPGHIDFTAETERALCVLDYAILLLSSVEGIQGHTETLWNMLKKHNIPVVFFINKTDRMGADAERVFEDIKRTFTENAVMYGSDDMIEKTAEKDDNLLEMYLSDNYNEQRWLDVQINLIKKRELFPCFFGSALNNEGIKEFLDGIDKLTKTSYDSSADFSARVYKIRYDNNGNRLTFMKIECGRLKVKTKLEFTDKNGEQIFESINEMRKYSGSGFEPIHEAKAGEICAVTGLSQTKPGQVIGSSENIWKSDTVPMLVSKVFCDDAVAPVELVSKLRILEDEEPLLGVEWNSELQEIHIHVMGTIQLEVLQSVFLERFGINIHFGKCEVLYLETINNAVIGCGHFEPLKHYAEVHFKLEPLERGRGIQFESACSFDVLDRNWQNLIYTHIFEKEHRGVLTCSPITDIKITLLIGRTHLKHTHGGDLREASYRAIRQGLKKAECILLEPVYKFKITVPADYFGRVVTDIKRMSGEFGDPIMDEKSVTLSGILPVSEAMEYPKELISFTKGQGRITMMFGGYVNCHNTNEVIERIGYDAENDRENSADSIFCSHGSGYTVKWNEADGHMHCEV